MTLCRIVSRFLFFVFCLPFAVLCGERVIFSYVFIPGPVPFLPEIQPLGSIFPALSLHFQICQSQNYSPQIAHAAARRRKRVEVWGLSRGSCQKNALSTNQVFFCPDFSVDGFYFSERETGRAIWITARQQLGFLSIGMGSAGTYRYS